MEIFLYKLLTFYFGIGAIVIFLLGRNKTAAEKREKWLKYFTYLVVVNFIFASILMDVIRFGLVASGIIAFGLLELMINLKSKGSRKDFVLYLLVYAVLAFSFFKFSQVESSVLFFTYFLVIVFDGFSQLSGQLFGRSYFLPKLSPNKTVEGLLGGSLLTICTAVLVRGLLPVEVSQSVFLGLGVSIAAFSGDLLASWGKRHLGIKDYSNWIPGHGGFLDRFDSLIGTSCLMYIVFSLIECL